MLWLVVPTSKEILSLVEIADREKPLLFEIEMRWESIELAHHFAKLSFAVDLESALDFREMMLTEPEQSRKNNCWGRTGR